MKDKHYHYLFGYFFSEGFGCVTKIVKWKNITTKNIIEICKEIEKENNSKDVGIFSFDKLECDCDE